MSIIFATRTPFRAGFDLSEMGDLFFRNEVLPKIPARA